MNDANSMSYMTTADCQPAVPRRFLSCFACYFPVTRRFRRDHDRKETAHHTQKPPRGGQAWRKHAYADPKKSMLMVAKLLPNLAPRENKQAISRRAKCQS